jgi:hypothetical protein
MTFQPGHNLATGRPPGAANRRSEELRRRLKDRGDVDPADYCSSIVSNPNEPTELKLQAANFLLPYLYPKRGAVATPRYIDDPVQLPEPATIEQANKNIAYISNLKAKGLIDLDFANSLIADNTTIEAMASPHTWDRSQDAACLQEEAKAENSRCSLIAQACAQRRAC